jgi:hypothetical protein
MNGTKGTAAATHRRTIVVATALLLVLTSLPSLAAWIWPPRGQVFAGALFYQDDFHQYVSFSEQAMRGRFLFANKFDVRPQTPYVVNLEWWLGGVLARLLGERPILGFHALRPLALLVFVSGAARVLRRANFGGKRLAWALLLVFSASGLGALRLWQGAIGWHIPDLLMAMYPWHQSLTSAHTAFGSGLALWALALLLEWRGGESRWPVWVPVVWVLGLVRPYDVLTFGVTAGVLLLLDLRQRDRRAGFVRRALALAGLLPVFAYYFWLTQVEDSLRGWDGVQSGDLNPPVAEFLWALAPAVVLIALAQWRTRALTASEGRDARLAAGIWAGFLVALVAFYPAPLMKTFVATLGVMTVLLAALATPERWLPWATLALSPTSLFLLWRVLNPSPTSFLPAEYFRATNLLASRCAPGDVALAPTDLSLLIAALSPCHVALGHRGMTPGYPLRLKEGNRFYHDPATPPAWRRQYLDQIGARFVLLAPGTGVWLQDDDRWLPKHRSPMLEVWERERR